ncbi:alpha/beta hydrolase [Synechococcus sp. HK05]|uniref:alpha/beta fold hydrolase n=1 Tax=Synechococcus sp. HK05 TaxID=2725975 RepID=UPI001C394050|nr:alpha/beta hydrolase [Synechococcus sp. HK05]MBV2350116.1 alpha/beta hydrolase [Synechococcus sp. HK05]
MSTATPTTQLIAAHGWAGDSRAWQPWAEGAAARGWAFSATERGYGQLTPQQPSWMPQAEERVVVGHSLGPHLLPPQVWEQATCAVWLASFAAFVPEGRAGRSTRAALQVMGQRLAAGDTTALLRDFFREAAAPQPPSALPMGPLEQGITALGQQRLLEDLQLLELTAGLPMGYPTAARALIVEAADDRIVQPSSRAALRALLPQAELWSLEPAGHCLLDPELPERVLGWIADGQP